MNNHVLNTKEVKNDQNINESENELRLKILCYRFMLKEGRLKNTAILKQTKKKLAVKLTETSNKQNIASSLPNTNVESSTSREDANE